jgi:hypothetical protein
MITAADAKSRWIKKIGKYNLDYVTPRYHQMEKDNNIVNDDNTKHIITTQNVFSESWFEMLKSKVNYRLRLDHKRYKAAEAKSIKNRIDKRVEIIRDDQTTWLSSILDKKTHNRIVLDKVLVDEEAGTLTKRLATDPEEVKKIVDEDFARMFRKRNTQLNALTPFWQQIYEPTGKFQEDMETTIKAITLDEWNSTVKDLNKKSTAGLSGINYRIIQQLPEEMVLLLILIGNVTIQTGRIPKAWKTSVILPIPKPINFEYDVLNTRPIALLDCFRKTFTKLITNRLSAVLKQYNILQGYNCCGLPSESTNEPIQLVNNFIEDARKTRF